MSYWHLPSGPERQAAKAAYEAAHPLILDGRIDTVLARFNVNATVEQRDGRIYIGGHRLRGTTDKRIEKLVRRIKYEEKQCPIRTTKTAGD